MESTLFIIVKSPTPEHQAKLLWMLGDDAPIFDDEVASEWHALFYALEEFSPPEDILTIEGDFVLMNWLCSYWDEAFNESSALLMKAGFTEQAAYYWADEEEGYLRIKDNHCKKIIPKSTEQTRSVANTVSGDWGEEDKLIIASLLSLFESL